MAVQYVLEGKTVRRESTYITTPEELSLVIQNPKDSKYFGKTFCARGKDDWVAIDNSTGDAWTESFKCFIEMAKWFLKNEGVLL